MKTRKSLLCLETNRIIGYAITEIKVGTIVNYGDRNDAYVFHKRGIAKLISKSCEDFNKRYYDVKNI